MRFQRARTIVLLTAAALAALAAQPCSAAQKHRKRPVSRRVSQDVAATPEIDARVNLEVAQAKDILAALDSDNLLASPYLVSAIYYHDGFLSTFPKDRGTADPERRIVAQISNLLTPEIKARFVGLLHLLWEQSAPPSPRVLARPLSYFAMGASSRTHMYAIDLFTREGSPVRSVSRGIVVLADHGWSPDDLFSTSSRNGGNAVIVFDPDQDRFYRFCHLSTVLVSRGDLLAAGDTLGTVGHSGLNAAREGHGGHLHFEMNEITEGRVKAVDHQRLRKLLRTWGT